MQSRNNYSTFELRHITEGSVITIDDDPSVNETESSCFGLLPGISTTFKNAMTLFSDSRINEDASPVAMTMDERLPLFHESDTETTSTSSDITASDNECCCPCSCQQAVCCLGLTLGVCAINYLIAVGIKAGFTACVTTTPAASANSIFTPTPGLVLGCSSITCLEGIGGGIGYFRYYA